MSYGNYAPFYRGSYFNPMQNQVPNMGENQPQFSPAYQPPIQQPQIPSPQPANEMIWVLNENEATSYPVAPNNTVTLWDKNEATIYIKSVNAQGIPSMRILDFTERTANTQKPAEPHICNCGKDFVKIEDFNALSGKYDALFEKYESLSERVDNLIVKNTSKTAKTTKGDAE